MPAVSPSRHSVKKSMATTEPSLGYLSQHRLPLKGKNLQCKAKALRLFLGRLLAPGLILFLLLPILDSGAL